MIETKRYPGNLEVYRDNWRILSVDLSTDALKLWCPPSINPDSPFTDLDEAVADFMSDFLDNPDFELDLPLSEDEKQTLCADVKFAVYYALGGAWTEYETEQEAAE